MPSNGWRIWMTLMMTISLMTLAGCGLSANPRSFPYYLPPGDIVPTHAKPPGLGYYANFDPNAVQVDVRPQEGTNPVGTQHVIMATVRDANGTPRRKRRVEWMLEGVGNIVEVDESGYLPGRGYKLDSKSAVSYTNYYTHKITRGNLDPNDDFVLRPGQTWCVVSSAVEGDTYVSVVVPAIANWDKRKVTVNCRWVDATWIFPSSAQVNAGSQHQIVTKLLRYTDKQPLANYKVRYKIIDGPPATLLPNNSPEAVVVSGIDGDATVTIAQQTPQAGTNRVSIEVIRPPDPTKPSGVGIVLAKAETTVEWLAPQIKVNLTGPSTVAVNSEATYSIQMTNVGKIPIETMTVTNDVPTGFQYVRSDTQNSADGQRLIWTLLGLQPGQSRTVNVTYRAQRLGTIQNCVDVFAENGTGNGKLVAKDSQCVNTAVTQPGLRINISGDATATVGGFVTYQISVANPGSGPAENVVLEAGFDAGLSHESKANPIYLNLQTLAPNESKVLPLTLKAERAGRFTTTIVGKADGGLQDQARWTVDVAEPKMSLKLIGPQRRPVDGKADWNIRVTNDSTVPLNNVSVRTVLPPELRFSNASDGGSIQNNEVVWDLGVLPAGRDRVISLSTLCQNQPGLAKTEVVATSQFGLRQQQQATLEIYGIGGLEFQASDENDPILIGKQTVYTITVRNTGTAAVKNVDIRAILPKEMRFMGGQGPAGLPQNQNNVITFGRIPSLESQKELKFQITAEAIRAGDVRFRAEMLAEGLREPVISDEATSIVDPSDIRNGNPPPVPGLQPPQPNLNTSQPQNPQLPSAPAVKIGN